MGLKGREALQASKMLSRNCVNNEKFHKLSFIEEGTDLVMVA